MANKETSGSGIKVVNGFFKVFGVLLVSKEKVMIKDENGKENPDNYFYRIGFTNGENVVLLTCGKIGDTMEVFKKYDCGFNFESNKLKLIDYIVAE